MRYDGWPSERHHHRVHVWPQRDRVVYVQSHRIHSKVNQWLRYRVLCSQRPSRVHSDARDTGLPGKPAQRRVTAYPCRVWRFVLPSRQLRHRSHKARDCKQDRRHGGDPPRSGYECHHRVLWHVSCGQGVQHRTQGDACDGCVPDHQHGHHSISCEPQLHHECVGHCPRRRVDDANNDGDDESDDKPNHNNDSNKHSDHDAHNNSHDFADDDRHSWPSGMPQHGWRVRVHHLGQRQVHTADAAPQRRNADVPRR